VARLRLKFVQSFGGYHYFRRRGQTRVRLPGIPGSAEFMDAYQAALAAAPIAIGASKRSGPGSVSVAIAEYYGSQSFRSLTGETPAKRRAILERAAHSHGGSWLLDPKLLATAVSLGRSLGWQRLLPVALLGFMAAQWAREYRQHSQERDSDSAE